MLKLRMHGETAEIERMIETVCNRTPNVRVLSVSKPYKDRGASVYERCYMDIEIHEIETTPTEELKKLICKTIAEATGTPIDFQEGRCEVGCTDCIYSCLPKAIVDAGYGDIKQAVREFAEELKEIYNNLDYLPSGDEFSNLINERIQERYGK